MTTTRTATNQRFNQMFEMPGTYSNGDTIYCSILILDNAGVYLEKGESLGGTVSATGSVSLSIVTSAYYRIPGGGHACGTLLPPQLYSTAGQTFQFQWTAPYPGTFYLALYNANSNRIEVSLSMYEVKTTVTTYVYSSYQTPTTGYIPGSSTSHTSQSATAPNSTAILTTPQTVGLNISGNAILSVVVAAVVTVSGALYLYKRRTQTA